MNQRHIDILACIRQRPGIKLVELADELGVSTRTLRSDLKALEACLEGVAAIEHERGKGFRLRVLDAEALRYALGENGLRPSSVPETRDGRVSYLLNDLLLRSGWITVDELSGILFVSPRTLSNDLKHIESKLSEFDLALERRPYYGLRVSGQEMNRRLCLASLAMDASERTSLGEPADADMKTVARCVEEATAVEGFQVNSIVYQNLLVHLAVALTRIRANCYVPMEAEHLKRLQRGREYAVAARIAANIGREFSVELPEEEIAYITIHLAGKQTLPQGAEAGEVGLVISDEVWDVVSEMLECVWETFRFDFRGDLELRMNLARHIVPLAVRLRYHMRLENPLLSDIKKRFPLAYSMALDTASVLTRHYDAAPSDDETGYIALAFALALERQKDEAPKKNILVVCASGAGSARLLEHRYRREFASYAGSITACDVSHLDKVDFSRIDYVFTTVPIAQALPVPVREVEFFLDSDEVEDLKRILSETSGSAAEFESFFSPELFYAHVSVRDKREAIAWICNAVGEVEELPDGFLDLVEQREQLAQTAFGNSVAMPHPLEPVTDRTFVAVALLDNPIAWGGREVSAIFLISIAREREHDLNEFYDSFSRMLLSRDAIAHVLSDRSFDVLIEEYRRSSQR